MSGGTYSRELPLRLVLFGVVAVAAVGLGFLAFSASETRAYMQRFGYYSISLTFAWAVVALIRIRHVWCALPEAGGRERGQTAAVVAGCLVLAVTTAPTLYRVLYDEMVLQATAWQMHFFREVSTVLRAYRIEGVFASLDTFLDKRPFFFAYVLSLVHDLVGYRESNAFHLNHGLLVVVLGQIYVLARRVAAHVPALAAVFAFGTMSLVAHNATGAGMEMLNLAMLLLCAQLAVVYLDAPDEKRLAALVLASVLLAQTRYESSLFVGSTAFVVLEGWRRARRVILSPAAIFCPLLLVPYAMHNTYLSDTPILWELRNDAVTRFSFEHFGTNVRHALNYFFNVRDLMNNSWWLAGAGMASMAYLVVRAWRSRLPWRELSSVTVVAFAFGFGVCGNLLLLMFYYWGQLDDPIVGRLSLPFHVLLTFCLAAAVDRLSTPGRRLARWVVAGALLSGITNGFQANAFHSDMNTVLHEIAWERDFVATLPPGERLIITNKSALPWLLQHTSAIMVFQARQRAEPLAYHFAQRTFREVLVCQAYLPTRVDGGFQVVPGDRLPDGFVLEPIVERRFGARLARISRLVEVKPAGGPVADSALATSSQ